MSVNRDAVTPLRTSELRAAQTNTCTSHEPSRAEQTPEANASEDRFLRAERAAQEARTPRTDESVRAETSHRSPTELPYALSRMQAAAVLHKVLVDHGVSQNRLADMLDVDEKQVRKYLDGRAHFPTAALLVMPSEMADDFIARLRALRGSRTSAVDRLRSALAELEADGATPEVKLEVFTRVGALPTKGTR